MRKTLHPPPPQTTPTFEIENQNKGIEDIMDIYSNCPYLLFGETTSHLTSKLNVTDGRTDGRTDRRGGSIFLNVENSIKREIRKNCFPPPPDFFLYTNFLVFFNVGNSMNREENMKYWKQFFFSIFKKFIKNSNNIPSISKTTHHTPMTWCTHVQSFEKIHQCVFELQCEN